MATVSVVFLRGLVQAIGAAGVDTATFLADVGIDPEVLEDDEARVPREVSIRAWALAPRHTGDRDFGLHVAERMPIGTYGVLEYAVRSSPNVSEGLRRIARYYRLVSDMSDIRVDGDGDVVRVVHPGTPGTPRGVADCILATLVAHGRRLVDPPIEPEEVAFSYPQPDDTSEHERYFGAKLRFDAGDDSLTIDANVLHRPLLSANSALCAVLDQHAEALLSKLGATDPLLQRVRTAIAAALGGGDPSLAAVAKAVHMSGRTLQRALKERGTTHLEIVDSMRHDLALLYLGEKNVTLTEVAFLLGFSETSAFHRAFKRWTGVTPREHRERLGGPAS